MKTTAMRGRDDPGPMMHLGDDHLRRLGISPRAGDEIEFHGRAKVRSVGESDGKDGIDRHSSIEITHMGAEHKGMSLHDTVAEAAGSKK